MCVCVCATHFVLRNFKDYIYKRDFIKHYEQHKSAQSSKVENN